MAAAGDPHTRFTGLDSTVQVECTAARKFFDRLLSVYMSPEPIIPLDRATLVEHVHQSVMYGQLLYRRLTEIQRATTIDSEERLHYKQLVSCVGAFCPCHL
jgi:hypothetical protein